MILKTYVFWSTATCRMMVRKAMEPYPLGIHQRELYDKIHEMFPDARHDDIPKPRLLMPGDRVKGGRLKQHPIEPPKREHPIRSRKYLKRTVLAEMALRGEVELVHLKQGLTNQNGERLDAVKIGEAKKEWMKTDLDQLQEWRWRLKPGYVLPPNENVDPDPDKMFERRRVSAIRKLEGSRITRSSHT